MSYLQARSKLSNYGKTRQARQGRTQSFQRLEARMEHLISSSYEHKLAYIYHKIDQRGILTDRHKLAKLRTHCNDSITSLCNSISSAIGTTIYLGAENKPSSGTSVNINYSPNLQALLKSLGFASEDQSKEQRHS